MFSIIVSAHMNTFLDAFCYISVNKTHWKQIVHNVNTQYIAHQCESTYLTRVITQPVVTQMKK